MVFQCPLLNEPRRLLLLNRQTWEELDEQVWIQIGEEEWAEGTEAFFEELYAVAMSSRGRAAARQLE